MPSCVISEAPDRSDGRTVRTLWSPDPFTSTRSARSTTHELWALTQPSTRTTTNLTVSDAQSQLSRHPEACFLQVRAVRSAQVSGAIMWPLQHKNQLLYTFTLTVVSASVKTIIFPKTLNTQHLFTLNSFIYVLIYLYSYVCIIIVMFKTYLNEFYFQFSIAVYLTYNNIHTIKTYYIQLINS